jgi:serine/threonine protein phosphatase PrpC
MTVSPTASTSPTTSSATRSFQSPVMTFTGRKRTPARRGKANNTLLGLSLCIIVTCLLCTFVLFLCLPAAAPADELFPDERERELMCPSYGCPVYPLEVKDDMVVKTLKDLSRGRVTSVPPFARPLGTTVTYQGESHPVNQDRAFIIRPFRTKQSEQYGEEESFLLAILDGHGVEGHIVAEYVSLELPRLLAAKLDNRLCCESDEWIQKQLNATFVEVNAEAPPNALRGGCTASLTLRIGSKLYFANAGDSRTILVSINPKDPTDANILYETRRDKAHLPDERARIEKLGGKIHIPPQNPALSRVIVYSAAAIPPETIGLAMSRSIGDWEWKAIGVTAEPIVNVVDLSPYYNGTQVWQDTFVLAASDGLWDLRKKEFFAKHFAQSLPSNLLQTCVDAINLVSPKKGYRDDITVIIAPTTIRNMAGDVEPVSTG